MKLVFLTILIQVFLGCRAEQPAADPAKEKPLFKHALVSASLCSECHSKDRPAAFLNYPHGGGKECQECHIPKDDRSGWLPRKQFDHNPSPSSCLDCHIKERPALPHPDQGDCVMCHAYPRWK